MARGLSPAATAAVSAEVVYLAHFLHISFDDGPWRTWSGRGDISINGDIYTGTGELVSIDLPAESADLTAHPAQIVVAGIPADMMQRALTQQIKNRIATIQFGFFDGEGALIEPPAVFTRVRLNVPSFDEAAGTITVSAESKLRDLRRAQAVLYSSADQQTFFPNVTDRAFEYVPRIGDASVYWGDGDPE